MASLLSVVGPALLGQPAFDAMLASFQLSGSGLRE